MLTGTLFGILTLRLLRTDWKLRRGKSEYMVMLAFLTTLLMLQMQLYYESPLYQQSVEGEKPHLAYSDTNASVEIRWIPLDEGFYGPLDGLFVGPLGIVMYVDETEDPMMLRSMRTTDGVSWDGPHLAVLLGNRTHDGPRAFSCDLRVEQARIVCDYSFLIGAQHLERVAYTTSTQDDGLNWSTPARILDYEPGGVGFELPSKLKDFAWTDVWEVGGLPTSRGGTIVAIRYSELDSAYDDTPSVRGPYFASRDREGRWTGLVNIPPWGQWTSFVKLHELSPGRYMAVGLRTDMMRGDNIACVIFTEEALTDVRPPAPPSD